MNKKAFARLPADLQQILTTAMRVVAYDMYIHFQHESAVNWANMKREYPAIQVKSFPKDVINAMQAANSALLAAHAEKDPLAKRIQHSQASYMAKARAWTEIADQAYLNSMSE